MFPDSPRVLFNKGDSEGAERALRLFRGPSYDIEPELAQYGIDKKKRDADAVSICVCDICARGTDPWCWPGVEGEGLVGSKLS